ncbi:MAG: hypothetical protein MJ016_02415 [Victivallaceae bacterium]|nr:hypothetical protein [Victivallaceae bacterium]
MQKQITNEENQDPGKLFAVLKSMAMKPADVQKEVATLKKNIQNRKPDLPNDKVREFVAKSIIKKYTFLATLSGAVTSIPAAFSGKWVVVAGPGGATIDIGYCMKLHIDMCMCLAECYDYDITSVDMQNICWLIWIYAAGAKFGVKATADFLSKAGIKMIQQYLKGSVLVIIKEILKKLGIKFTRQALIKFLPGAANIAVSAAFNYGYTRFEARCFKKWFDLAEGEEEFAYLKKQPC